MKKLSAVEIRSAKTRGDKLAAVTAYDVTFARLLDAAGADILLVGDSLGMVVQGLPNTLPVTLDDMIYHTRAVARGASRAHVVTDLPFLSFQTSPEDALRAAGRLVKEGNAESVKLEGGIRTAEAVRRIVEAGVPVMGHIGLLPQSVHEMGGFKVQGRGAESRRALLADARALEQAGAYALVVEGVPSDVGAEVTASLGIPTIGIGAGPDCDGQVLVCYDLLGMFAGFKPKFVKRFASLGDSIQSATRSYVEEVKSGAFPDAAHSFAPVSTAAHSSLSTEAGASAPGPAIPKTLGQAVSPALGYGPDANSERAQETDPARASEAAKQSDAEADT